MHEGVNERKWNCWDNYFKLSEELGNHVIYPTSLGSMNQIHFIILVSMSSEDDSTPLPQSKTAVSAFYIIRIFFCLGKFLNWIADDQPSSITKGSVFYMYIKHLYIQPFSMELVWKWIDKKLDIIWMHLLRFIFVDTAFSLCGAELPGNRCKVSDRIFGMFDSLLMHFSITRNVMCISNVLYIHRKESCR